MIGDICAPVVIVNSTIEGNVYSSSRVELAANAVVNGDVHYQIIEMLQGAQINGGLMYCKDGSARSSAEPSDSDSEPEQAREAESELFDSVSD